MLKIISLSLALLTVTFQACSLHSSAAVHQTSFDSPYSRTSNKHTASTPNLSASKSLNWHTKEDGNMFIKDCYNSMRGFIALESDRVKAILYPTKKFRWFDDIESAQDWIISTLKNSGVTFQKNQRSSSGFSHPWLARHEW